MQLYAGFDLHANNNYLGVVDANGKRILKKKLSNEPGTILNALDPLRQELVGIVVESTFNWYWLVDLLMDEGYEVHLANPTAMQKYSGLKYSDDIHDAFWLAEMLRLGILPTGYIYPKDERPVRDLLRKRGHFVQIRTSLILSLQNIIARNCGTQMKSNDIKRLREDMIAPILEYNEDLAMAGDVSKGTIDHLSRKIREIELYIEKKVKKKETYRYLRTLPGAGRVLGLTITLETGDIGRFPKVGDYSSYCRKVSSEWLSNGKKKGKGNKKNGNKYLSWAFSEVSECARRDNDMAQSYYNRKLNSTNRMVAHTALAHKLARASYYIMRDQVPFDPEKLFA